MTAADTCRKGHPRTAENTYIDPAGRRHCRVCQRANWTRRRRAAGQEPRRLATDEACANGHPWTDASTLRDEAGRRKCRVCQADAMRRRRRSAPKPPPAPKPPQPGRCPQGHPMTPDNTRRDPLWGEQCITCLEASMPEHQKRGARRTSDATPITYIMPADAEPWAVDAVRRILASRDALDLADMLGVTA